MILILKQKHIAKVDFQGDPNIGLFGLATDKYVIIPSKIKDSEILGKNIVNGQVAQTNLNGIFLAGNSNGVLVPNIINSLELKRIKEKLKDVEIKVLETKYTALGNLILCNDKGCIASGLLKDKFEEIESVLDVDVKEGKILNTEIVGSLCVSTNKGFLLTMHASKEEFDFIKKVLKVDGDIGSVNFGSIFVKSGIIANSRGVLVGNQTTGPEIGRIDEALGFL